MCYKIVNFDRTEVGFTSKWVRISPAVQWCYQNQRRRRVISLRNLLHRQAGRQAGDTQTGKQKKIWLVTKGF